MATANTSVLPNAPYPAMAMHRAGAMGQYSDGVKTAPGGVDLDVLMCVSTWEHTWLRDWGVAGKREFLETWWECIDWGVVEANAGGMGEKKQRHGRGGTQDY